MKKCICGKEIKKDPRWSAKTYEKIKYCSRECYRKNSYSKEKRYYFCKNCNVKVNVKYPYLAKRYTFCSSKCQLNYEYKTNKRDRFKITQAANKKVREIGQPKLRGRTLSEEHKRKISMNPNIRRYGRNNPNYKEENTAYNYRRRVLMLRGLKCEKCGENKPEEELVAHHIKLARYNIKGSLIGGDHSFENLLVVCLECHKSIHNR